ncbi:Uncharacterised protein [uncultured archaeon]|nr:Uncharacterised protein [uncultured archaeon]
MPEEAAHKHKFEESIPLELKNATDEKELTTFQMVIGELKSEGEHYSLNRESFIKFFNDLTASQQKELLAQFSSPERAGKNLYDVAQEYNARLMQAKP